MDDLIYYPSGIFMLDELTVDSLLFDFYGELLPEKQREFFRLYHEENCSLQEIAEEYGVTRQGVHDAVRKAENSLRSYEEKLGLVDRFTRTEEVLRKIDTEIDSLMNEFSENRELAAGLLKIKLSLDTLEE